MTSRVENAAHLELHWGDTLREHLARQVCEASDLSRWLLLTHGVSVRVRVCGSWLNRTWTRRDELSTAREVEAALGEQLRLPEYGARLGEDAGAQEVADELLEQQPRVRVSSLLLRRWYAEYHPASGPVTYSTAEELETAMGDVLREQYPGLRYKQLLSALGRRRKVVIISQRVSRSWLRQYGGPAGEPQAAPGAMRGVLGAAALEEAVGARYRMEVIDIGLGFSSRDMRRRLVSWGFDASREACQESPD